MKRLLMGILAMFLFISPCSAHITEHVTKFELPDDFNIVCLLLQ